MLTETDRTILDFEETNWETGHWEKEKRARRQLGLTLTRYQQRLNAIVGDPDALPEYPQLVYRIRARAEKRGAEAQARLIGRSA